MPCCFTVEPASVPQCYTIVTVCLCLIIVAVCRRVFCGFNVVVLSISFFRVVTVCLFVLMWKQCFSVLHYGNNVCVLTIVTVCLSV